MVVFTLFTSGIVFAQGMPALSGVEGMGDTATVSDGHTAREEAEGKVVWEKLSRSQDRGSSTESGQAKTLACKDLSDDNFGTLGEYFMGQMMGSSHEAMNNMMIQMMGEKGEEQMHVVMGKRLSGCDTSAAFPSQGTGFVPMMQMMMGGWSFNGAQDRSSPTGFNQGNNSMMNFGFGSFGVFSLIFMILWWVLIIVGIVTLIKWLTSQSRGTPNHEKSALEILKERYAKGEIDKKEFEDKFREIKNL